MNAERLLAHYDKIVDAPDATPRLRRFVLDLAVRGKLVPQDPDDEPASELLKRIEKEKARLVRAGRVRGPAALGPTAGAEALYALPGTWAWVRVEQVLDELQTGPFGSSLHQSDYRVGGVPVVNPASNSERADRSPRKDGGRCGHHQEARVLHATRRGRCYGTTRRDGALRGGR